MEHIIQFAVGVDDEAIRNRVVAAAEEQIIKDIEQQVRDKLFSANYYGRHADEKSPLSDYSKNLINEFLEKHSEEIVDKTAVYLADKLSRTKKAKEILNSELITGDE